MEPFQNDHQREMHYSHVVEMNRLDKDVVEVEMEASSGSMIKLVLIFGSSRHHVNCLLKIRVGCRDGSFGRRSCRKRETVRDQESWDGSD
ncbi:hypothetical protein Patl1_09902 [Pistacia atlantica]|uniref:Uncharacterized protein n=1 Tax=Pistacia atlantica TaxID=434234 RepID=A0ACC1A4F8_9ROSI|nr:hypothetical protein Patl1_09902 [Pistacia atlantica]